MNKKWVRSFISIVLVIVILLAPFNQKRADALVIPIAAYYIIGGLGIFGGIQFATDGGISGTVIEVWNNLDEATRGWIGNVDVSQPVDIPMDKYELINGWLVAVDDDGLLPGPGAHEGATGSNTLYTGDLRTGSAAFTVSVNAVQAGEYDNRGWVLHSWAGDTQDGYEFYTRVYDVEKMRGNPPLAYVQKTVQLRRQKWQGGSKYGSETNIYSNADATPAQLQAAINMNLTVDDTAIQATWPGLEITNTVSGSSVVTLGQTAAIDGYSYSTSTTTPTFSYTLDWEPESLAVTDNISVNQNVRDDPRNNVGGRRITFPVGATPSIQDAKDQYIGKTLPEAFPDAGAVTLPAHPTDVPYDNTEGGFWAAVLEWFKNIRFEIDWLGKLVVAGQDVIADGIDDVWQSVVNIPANIAALFVPTITPAAVYNDLSTAVALKFPFGMVSDFDGIFTGSPQTGYPVITYHMDLTGGDLIIDFSEWQEWFSWFYGLSRVAIWLGCLYAVLRQLGMLLPGEQEQRSLF